jgi:hypothetical protein
MRAELEEVKAKFGESVVSLREMAGSIRGELDATRADLARGVLDLPRETQDATGEMRRVVADQIKALNELSALVARTGRSVDVAQAQPQRRTAEAGARAVAAQPSGTTGGAAQPLAQTAVQPVAAPAPAAVPAPAARPALAATARIEARPSARQAPVQASAQAPAAAGNATKRGWLSDLLTRASLDDEDEAEAAPAASSGGSPAAAPAAAPQPAREARPSSVETGRVALDTISTDIARMIDHRTAVDLWERYRRGETGLFDPRIYTPQGRATFAEIQRRYRAEPEFRRSVDRYVGEFERLLGDVVQNDPEAKRTDAYLTSETGKVYTMLAHASGRFDGV